MAKYFATMVKGERDDGYVGQSQMFIDSNDLDSRGRPKSYHFRKQGVRLEIPESMFDKLRDKAHPVPRGPKMFDIEVIEEESPIAAPAAPVVVAEKPTRSRGRARTRKS